MMLAASLEHPETHWVDSSGGVGIMICGPLLKHSKVIMAKKLALSQKGHRNEAAPNQQLQQVVVSLVGSTGMLNSMYNVVRVIGGSDPINSV